MKQREIKFRLWNGSKMEEVGSITFHTDGSYHVNDEYPVNDIEMENKFGGNKYYLLAYTGLKDKNGKEIYEGDIVKGVSWKEPIAMKNYCEVPGVVKLSDNFGYRFSGELPKGFRTYPNLKSCEIVGNIYENPDLLK